MDTKQIAQRFTTRCRELGFRFEVRGNLQVIAIYKTIPVNDNHAFIDAETDSYELLSMLPLRGGSTWGTDGGSVGGHVAMTTGRFEMKKSGTNGKRLLGAIGALAGK